MCAPSTTRLELHGGSDLGQWPATDAYLAGLARHFEGRLVSFDRGLGAVHPDVVLVLPAD